MALPSSLGLTLFIPCLFHSPAKLVDWRRLVTKVVDVLIIGEVTKLSGESSNSVYARTSVCRPKCSQVTHTLPQPDNARHPVVVHYTTQKLTAYPMAITNIKRRVAFHTKNAFEYQSNDSTESTVVELVLSCGLNKLNRTHSVLTIRSPPLQHSAVHLLVEHLLPRPLCYRSVAIGNHYFNVKRFV